MLTQTLSRLEASALAEVIRSSVWAYPLLETVHIACFAVLFGSLVLLEVRVFGIGRDIALAPLMRLAVTVALVAFVGAASSGSLLFISSATEFAAHPAFQAKLVLIAVAGLNAVVFHLRGSVQRHDGVARLQAAASAALWLLVITAGRLIAYL